MKDLGVQMNDGRVKKIHNQNNQMAGVWLKKKQKYIFCVFWIY